MIKLKEKVDVDMLKTLLDEEWGDQKDEIMAYLKRIITNTDIEIEESAYNSIYKKMLLRIFFGEGGSVE